MSGADKSSPDTSPTLFDMAMYEVATDSMLWRTPQSAVTEAKSTVKKLRGRTPQDPQVSLADQVAAGFFPPSTSSAAASPASPSATLAGDWEPKTTAGSGLSSPESYARLGPDGCWLRMYQGYFQSTLDGSLEECSGTWPRAGTMQAGIIYRQQPSAPRTSGIGSSSWPTPTAAAEAPNMGSNKKAWLRSLMEVAQEGMWPTPQSYSFDKSHRPGITKLDVEVRGMYPTPTARDYRSPGTAERLARTRAESSRGQPLTEQVGGQLNADWVSLLMGFEAGWTVVDGNAECRAP